MKYLKRTSTALAEMAYWRCFGPSTSVVMLVAKRSAFSIMVVFCAIVMSCCRSPYKNLQPLAAKSNCVSKFKPVFNASWYKTSVDVYGKHISGLLLFKTMPDSSVRVVFTNEVGVTFFDFEFRGDGGFKVHKVIQQLNRKVVIGLLRSDFQMIMMQGLTDKPLNGFTKDDEFFYALRRKKETDYFITDKDCASLLRIEEASKGKKKVEVKFMYDSWQSPDSIYLKHFTFDMQINLKKLPR